MRPPPALLRTEAKMGTRFPKALRTVGRGRASGASASSSSSLLSSSLDELMVSKTETGSSPIISASLSTRDSTSSSFQVVAVSSFIVISGMGCMPQSNTALQTFIQSASPEMSSREEISEPSLMATKNPETPVSATSAISSRIPSTLLESLAQYTTGTGPGKFPRASSCSLQKVRYEPKESATTKAVLALALRRISFESEMTAGPCSKMEVGSLGSGTKISGLSVSFPLGEDMACWSMARDIWAASAESPKALVGSTTSRGKIVFKTFILICKINMRL
mmetsp:Transcript_2349/g.4958  ORF Transcript_2349/g.4958 Transcript_2349/m.4958 type:complete len:278 (-) Transcript_2349:14-847(-)